MVEQVFTIGPDGSLSGLQRKPGQGIDLRKFGKANIGRASEILWNDEKQQWYVKFMLNVPCRYLSKELYMQAIRGKDYIYGIDCLVNTDMEDLVFFKEYGEAVKAEIRVLDYLRLKGYC